MQNIDHMQAIGHVSKFLEMISLGIETSDFINGLKWVIEKHFP